MDGLHVALEAPEDLPALPAAIEVAAYRIVQEALANATHHAQAHAYCVHITVREETLQVEVIDDGKGLPTEIHVGAGLLPMRERAVELEGTCQIGLASQGVPRYLLVCLSFSSETFDEKRSTLSAWFILTDCSTSFREE